MSLFSNRRSFPVKILAPVSSFAILAVIGSALVIQSQAATSAVNAEAENGTLSLPAAKVMNANASAGSAVLFQAASSGGGGNQTNNCAPNPHLCGYPDTTNTGVPAGTSFTNVPAQATSGTGWHWDSGDKNLVIDGAGVTVSGLNVSGCVIIGAANVTFKNSKVTATAGCSSVIYMPGYLNPTNAMLDHLEINGARVKDNDNGGTAGIKAWTNTTVSYTHIYATSDGIDTSDGINIHDNYIHDQWVGNNNGVYDHTDGIQSSGDTGITIVHNTIDNSGGNDSPILFGADLGSITNATANNNLMVTVPGQPAVRAGHNAGSSYKAKNIQFLNNRIVSGAYYSFIPDGTNVLTFTGNVVDGNGAAIADFSSKGDGSTQYLL